jgi:hypothetical protein
MSEMVQQAGRAETMDEPSILCDGTSYVLVEVRDGYQIWDRQDYFSVTPRGCPRHYHSLGEGGEDAAWRSFYELEPATGAGEG